MQGVGNINRDIQLLWITDPWNTLDHTRDTTLRLIEESVQLGMMNFWCDVKTIRLENSEVLLNAQQVIRVAPARKARSFVFKDKRSLQPKNFTQIFYRPDPPVNLAYLHPLQILALGLRDVPGTELINPLRVLLESNEKLENFILKDFTPPSIVSSQWEKLAAFGHLEKTTVLKPLHQAQSKGVVRLHWSSRAGVQQAQRILEKTTQQFQVPVLLQHYLPEIQWGELRLWFVDGDLLACVRKLPARGEFRIDMDRGGSLARAEPDSVQKKMIQKIGRILRRQKIRMAAVDVIGHFVTDFNFTSPGLLPQIENLLGKNLAQPLLGRLLRRS